MFVNISLSLYLHPYTKPLVDWWGAELVVGVYILHRAVHVLHRARCVQSAVVQRLQSGSLSAGQGRVAGVCSLGRTPRQVHWSS